MPVGRTFRRCLLIVPWLAGACQEQREQAGATEDVTATIAMEMIRAELLSIEDEYEAFYLEGDADSLATFFTDYAILALDGTGVVGRDAIRDYFEATLAESPGLITIDFILEELAIAESGEMAQSYGTVIRTSVDPSGAEFAEGKLYTATHRRNVNGAWRIALLFESGPPGNVPVKVSSIPPGAQVYFIPMRKFKTDSLADSIYLREYRIQEGDTDTVTWQQQLLYMVVFKRNDQQEIRKVEVAKNRPTEVSVEFPTTSADEDPARDREGSVVNE